MPDYFVNEWQPIGNTPGGCEHMPTDGKEFLIFHPGWICPAVVAYDMDVARLVFCDPYVADDVPEIVDFTDMWFYTPAELPPEFFEAGAF